MEILALTLRILLISSLLKPFIYSYTSIPYSISTCHSPILQYHKLINITLIKVFHTYILLNMSPLSPSLSLYEKINIIHIQQISQSVIHYAQRCVLCYCSVHLQACVFTALLQNTSFQFRLVDICFSISQQNPNNSKEASVFMLLLVFFSQSKVAFTL